MDSDFYIVSKKLNAFIKKYYLFNLLKGGLIILGLYILVLSTEAIIEYFNYLTTTAKKAIFYISNCFFALLFGYYIVFPLLSLFRLRKNISASKASSIISNHFPEIKDKLLNTLELNNLNSFNNSELLIASINQRSKELSPIPFKNALNFNHIKRNLLFFAISALVVFIILAFNPNVLTEGTSRLIDLNKQYERKAPFEFSIINKQLVCERGKDFIVQLNVTGEYIPLNVFIEFGGNSFLLNKSKENGILEFKIRNLNNSVDFRFHAEDFYSQKYTINVLPAPVLKSFTLDIFPPVYTGIDSESLINAGDITVPFGTNIKWNFKTNNVNNIFIKYNNDTTLIKVVNNVASNTTQILKDTEYSIGLRNENFKTDDELSYVINVIPDLFPEIELKTIADSLINGAFYFMVSIKDDYGFKDLKFVQELTSEDSIINRNIIDVQINKSKLQDVFYYFNFNDIEINSDVSCEYYFEIRDNDYISGYKKAITKRGIYRPLGIDEIRNEIKKHQDKTDAALNKSKELTKDIQKEIEEFRRKEMSGEVTQWEKQEFLKNIMEKQKKIDDLVKDLLKNNQQKNTINNQFHKEQNQILEKQKQIQQLLDEILDDELKQLLEEIKKLSEKFDDNQFEKAKEKLNLNYNNLDKNLERSLELLKRYKVEENIMNLSEDLQKLAEKENELSEKKLNKNNKNEAQKKQEELKEQFKKVKDEFSETKEDNKNLKSPFKFDKLDTDFKDIEDSMEELQQDMQQNSNKKNKKKQQEISKKLEDLSKKMQDMFSDMNSESLEINIENLRQVLDNLSIFSFNQENNYNDLNSNMTNSPKYPKIIIRQSDIKKDFDLINDSLNSIAQQIPQMSQLILKEAEALNENLEKATKELEERYRRNGLKFQRHVINNTNTLALYLDELMDQLNNQMQNSGSGKGKKKPQDAMQNLKKQQEKMKNELQKLLEQMKKEGGSKPGSEGNKQIVKTLAEQEIFEKMLKELQQGEGVGQEGLKKMEEIKKIIDENINDLINKNISPELIRRNERIKTRLLEAEKSEREREKEKKRESKEGVKNNLEIPEELKEELIKNKSFKETLKKNNLNMKQYYENITNEYFHNINE